MNKLKYLLLILILIACQEDIKFPDTPVDQPILDIMENLKGEWVSEYAELWENKNVHTTYYSDEIDCSIHYSWKFDIVKNIKIDQYLHAETEHYCTPNRFTTFSVARETDTDIYIIEYLRGSPIKKYVGVFSSDHNEVILYATDPDQKYFKVNADFIADPSYDLRIIRYVLKLTRVSK